MKNRFKFLSIAEAGRVIGAAKPATISAGISALQALLPETAHGSDAEGAVVMTERAAQAREAAGVLFGAFQEAELSHDETRTALYNAIRTNTYRPDGSRIWRWLRAVYNDSAVYEETDTEGIDRLYRVTYTINANGTVTLGAPVEVRLEVKYIPLDQAVSESQRPFQEAFIGHALERYVRDDGTALAKIISPGIGSCGYYPAEVLERDAHKIKAGTQMFANHKTAREREERPEGDYLNIMAVTTEDATWMPDGPGGPAVYAPIEVKKNFRETADDLGGDTGLSIDGICAFAWGEVDGREMPIVEELVRIDTVDFVTRAGRGGALMSVSEAAKLKKLSLAAPVAESTPKTKENNVEKKDEQTPATVPVAEAQRQVSEAAQKAVQVYRAAEAAGRAAIGELNLPEPVKARLLEAQLANIPLTAAGEVDAEALTKNLKDAAEAEASFARNAYGYGDGSVDLAASKATESGKATTVDLELAGNLIRMGL